VEGDHERRVTAERADAGEQARGGLRVEAFGRFVEQQYVRATEQALSDAEPAALPARERFAAWADRRVEPGREGGHGLVERGRSERLPELGLRGGGSCQP
jgi:hypothetical protein